MDAIPCDVPSNVCFHWNSVNWSLVDQTVRRLQTRIAKAVRAGDWRGARRLQRLLVRSTSGFGRSCLALIDCSATAGPS